VSFGEIPTVTRADTALIDTLKTWLPHYIAHVAAAEGVPTPSSPNGYRVVSELASFPEQGLPVITIISPGLADKTERKDGVVRGGWAHAIHVITQGRDDVEARQWAGIYGAAVRGCLIQQTRLAIVDERYDVIDIEDRRTLVGVLIQIQSPATLATITGPQTPPINPGDPPAGDPVIQTHTETATPRTPMEEL
jgi:hypothetical protein